MPEAVDILGDRAEAEDMVVNTVGEGGAEQAHLFRPGETGVKL
jgi:hypothetical protein